MHRKREKKRKEKKEEKIEKIEKKTKSLRIDFSKVSFRECKQLYSLKDLWVNFCFCLGFYG